MKKILKNLFITTITIQFVFNFYILSSANNQDIPPLMGLNWNTPEELEPYLLTDDSTTYSLLPSFVDNSNLFPPAAEQQHNDCVAYALAYAQKTAQEYLKRNWTPGTATHTFSPAFIYNSLNNDADNGLYLLEAAQFIEENGICPITYFNYNGTHNEYMVDPDENAYAAALLYQPLTMYITTTQEQIKAAISEGKGVVIGITVYDEMAFDMRTGTNNTYDRIYGTNHGGHAICLVGYDDTNQRFKFINSWGEDWCLNGYGYISYDLVANTTVSHHGANCGIVFNVLPTDEYILGDINEDNTINAADARLALRYSARVETPTSRQFVIADVDGNGDITAADAQNIANYSAGTINMFPIYE